MPQSTMEKLIDKSKIMKALQSTMEEMIDKSMA